MAGGIIYPMVYPMGEIPRIYNSIIIDRISDLRDLHKLNYCRFTRRKLIEKLQKMQTRLLTHPQLPVVISQMADRSVIFFDFEQVLTYHAKKRNITIAHLDRLKQKNCVLYAFSSKPNRMESCEAMRTELANLGLQNYFASGHPDGEIATLGNCYWQWGNCIACENDHRVDVYNKVIRCGDFDDCEVYVFDAKAENVSNWKIETIPNSYIYHVDTNNSVFFN